MWIGVSYIAHLQSHQLVGLSYLKTYLGPLLVGCPGVCKVFTLMPLYQSSPASSSPEDTCLAYFCPPHSAKINCNALCGASFLGPPCPPAHPAYGTSHADPPFARPFPGASVGTTATCLSDIRLTTPRIGGRPPGRSCSTIRSCVLPSLPLPTGHHVAVVIDEFYDAGFMQALQHCTSAPPRVAVCPG